MIYLDSFTFPSEDMELSYAYKTGNASYPFKVLSLHGVRKIAFEPITILYGNNGSGKSTALNVIADKMNLHRDSVYNKTSCYPDYVQLCDAEIRKSIPENSRIITSDDVFDYMLDIRCLNEGIDQKREVVCKDYLDAKYARFQVKSIADYDELKRVVKARGKTQRQFVKSELIDTVRELSNGENAYKYFIEKIGDGGLYLLDEPENSLSPQRQMELKSFIEDSARFFGCQFIMSTHSPFLLSLKDAKIYDLDENPVKVKPWTELEIVRIYREFFSQLE